MYASRIYVIDITNLSFIYLIFFIIGQQIFYLDFVENLQYYNLVCPVDVAELFFFRYFSCLNNLLTSSYQPKHSKATLKNISNARKVVPLMKYHLGEDLANAIGFSSYVESSISP